MDRTYISFNLANFITVGLIAAIFYAAFVGGFQFYKSLNSQPSS